MNRSETLDHVKEIITKDRQATHGEAENSFAAIASFWGLYLNRTITPAQVAEMMVLFKMARQMGNPHHADNLQDLIGYAAIAAEMRAPVPQKPVAQVSEPPQAWVKGQPAQFPKPSKEGQILRLKTGEVLIARKVNDELMFMHEPNYSMKIQPGAVTSESLIEYPPNLPIDIKETCTYKGNYFTADRNHINGMLQWRMI